MFYILSAIAFLANFALIYSLHNTPNTFTNSDSELVFSAAIFRHGDRTPMAGDKMSMFSKDTNTFPAGGGQLTRTGMEQEFALGQHLYNVFKPFIGENYFYKDVYAFSSDVERCLESAQMVMSGLFNHNYTFQDALLRPFPIHTVKKVDDFFMRAFDRGKCPLLDHWNDVEKYLQSEWIETVARVQSDLDSLKEIYGFHTSVLNEMGYLFDLVNVEKAHKLSYPEGMNEHLVNVSVEMNHWLMKMKVGSFDIAKLIVAPMMNDILSNTDSVVSNTTHPKLAVYSGHDTNIAELLMAFENYDTNIHYSSCIRFELYFQHSAAIYTLRMVFNDKVLHIPGCEGLDCTYNEFKNYIKNYFPADTTKGCAYDPEPEPDPHPDDKNPQSATVFIIICVVGSAIIIVPMLYLCLQKKKKPTEPLLPINNDNQYILQDSSA